MTVFLVAFIPHWVGFLRVPHQSPLLLVCLAWLRTSSKARGSLCNLPPHVVRKFLWIGTVFFQKIVFHLAEGKLAKEMLRKTQDTDSCSSLRQIYNATVTAFVAQRTRTSSTPVVAPSAVTISLIPVCLCGLTGWKSTPSQRYLFGLLRITTALQQGTYLFSHWFFLIETCCLLPEGWFTTASLYHRCNSTVSMALLGKSQTSAAAVGQDVVQQDSRVFRIKAVSQKGQSRLLAFPSSPVSVLAITWPTHPTQK